MHRFRFKVRYLKKIKHLLLDRRIIVKGTARVKGGRILFEIETENDDLASQLEALGGERQV
jgi:hypothetical protein